VVNYRKTLEVKKMIQPVKCPICGETLIPYIGADGEEYYDCPHGDYNSEDERYNDFIDEN
jgi:hypothetical protein